MDYRLLFAASGGLLVLAVVAASSDRLQEAYGEGRYQEIRVGMSRADVDKLLGRPTGKSFTTCEARIPPRRHTGNWAEDIADYAGASAEWIYGRHMITVGFSRGKVISKSWTTAGPGNSSRRGR